MQSIFLYLMITVFFNQRFHNKYFCTGTDVSFMFKTPNCSLAPLNKQDCTAHSKVQIQYWSGQLNFALSFDLHISAAWGVIFGDR